MGRVENRRVRLYEGIKGIYLLTAHPMLHRTSTSLKFLTSSNKNWP